MNSSLPDPVYDQLEQRLAAWAQVRADVRAVVVIGSRTRADHPADANSDLDTIIFVDDANVYTEEGGWAVGLQEELGLPTWFAALSYTGRNDPEWELVLEGGYKVDLVFTPNRSLKGREANLQDMLENFPYQRVLQSGMRVLVDKNPADTPIVLAAPQPQTFPTQAEFNNRIANYLLDLVRAAKLAQRGELWRAARAVNEGLHASLLALLEWQTWAQHGIDYRTWRYGRFLEEWADPRALAALPATYTNNTLAGVGCALRAGLDLLGWLGPEIADGLGLEYPREPVARTGAWLDKYLKS